MYVRACACVRAIWEQLGWSATDLVGFDRELASGTLRLPLHAGTWWPSPQPAACSDTSVTGDYLSLELQQPIPGSKAVYLDLDLPFPLIQAALNSDTNASSEQDGSSEKKVIYAGPWAGFGLELGSAVVSAKLPPAEASATIVLARSIVSQFLSTQRHCTVWWPAQISRQQKTALWTSRDDLGVTDTSLLPILVKTAPVLEAETTLSLLKLVNEWPSCNMAVWLQLLDGSIGSPAVRAFAVAQIDLIDSAVYSGALLLPVLSAIANEPQLDSALCR